MTAETTDGLHEGGHDTRRRGGRV